MTWIPKITKTKDFNTKSWSNDDWMIRVFLWIGNPGYVMGYIYISLDYTLRLLNIAMKNGSFLDDLSTEKGYVPCRKL